MKYPLFGIIYNWKGLKEENYLYTEEELKRFDEELYNDCMEKPNEWHDSKLIDCAWKTWMGFRIDGEYTLEKFLDGDYNDDHVEDDNDWYWENSEDNDLYGYPSDTMSLALREMRVEYREKIDWFKEITDRLRDYSDGDIWSTGDEILCKTESAADTLAEMLECLYRAQNEEVLVNTGYYDPEEDARNGEMDRYTGWWYVNID